MYNSIFLIFSNNSNIFYRHNIYSLFNKKQKYFFKRIVKASFVWFLSFLTKFIEKSYHFEILLELKYIYIF